MLSWKGEEKMLQSNLESLIDGIVNMIMSYGMILGLLTLQGIEMNLVFFALGYISAELIKWAGRYLVKEYKKLTGKGGKEGGKE